MPMAAFAAGEIVSTLLPPGAAIAVKVKAALTPKGAPETERAIEEEEDPPVVRTCAVTEPLAPAATVMDPGATVSVNPGVGAELVSVQ
jgi:hypothetical protein